jgi:Tfp pilus assembly protein PilF
MSLINQVLNDLEKRGASTNIGEATIRVVPLRKSHALLWWSISVLGLSVLLSAAWYQWGSGLARFKDAATPVVAHPAQVPVPAVAVAVAASGIADNLNTAAQAEIISPKPLVTLSPLIISVSPDPLIIQGKAQTVTIKGEHFSADAKLVLRSPRRTVLSHHQIVKQSSERIIFRVALPKRTGSWSVEVVNSSGHSSGAFAFSVQLPPLVAANSKPRSKPEVLVAPDNTRVQANPVPLVMPEAGVSKQITQISPQQQAENEYRKAYTLLQHGQTNAALSGFETALQLDAGHLAARQTLVRLLLDMKRPTDAERVLQEGLQRDPKQSSLALLLARIQVGRNELTQALDTMEKSLPYSAKQADYQAFVAALLQRLNRHKEAITYFQNALQINPQSGVWLMGLGISLRAEQRNAEAKEAFNRALAVHNLSAELQSFVAQQLKEL